jgi:hypothetical protein
MKEYKIKFPVDFDKDEAGPLHFGRLCLGKDQEFTCRIFFRTDGSLCIAVPRSAVIANVVVVYDDPLDNGLLGIFGLTGK